MKRWQPEREDRQQPIIALKVIITLSAAERLIDQDKNVVGMASCGTSQ
jgi:hypothetical protein